MFLVYWKKKIQELIDKSKLYVTFFYEIFSLIVYCATCYTTKEILKSKY
jgi:hypothetical protein